MHMNIHLKLNPYKCEYCEKTFTNSGSRFNHVHAHHFKEDFDKKNCKLCDFRETRFMSLSSHMDTHNNTNNSYESAHNSLNTKTNTEQCLNE